MIFDEIGIHDLEGLFQSLRKFWRCSHLLGVPRSQRSLSCEVLIPDLILKAEVLTQQER